MNDPLERTIRMNALYDLYGPLLTDKQREYFEYYYSEDYSLSEIADLLGVSRNAVHDQLRIVSSHLEEFEEKLGLLKHKVLLASLAERIRRHDPADPELASIADQIDKTE
ncbi:MAG TPA: YlxM family DNA-binding protein [Candidatus Izemoplasmatales bacterium]|nr:YlxM family DNA-binding protein [Bacillota bacterium]HRY78056.1 YlxM family DNA-binding protein [Candidatus Izemoplasmatales bacterium]